MMSPRYLIVALLGLLLPTPGYSDEMPNVLFIFADDLGWGDLGSYGHPGIKTPHLDRLAAEGARFEQFTVCSPVCSPSRAALLTGQFPARHSIHHAISGPRSNRERGMPDALNWEATLLPKLFQEAGYATGHFGKWHLSVENGRVAPPPKMYGYDESAIFSGPGKKVWEGSSFADQAGNAKDPVAAAFLTRAATEQAVTFLEENSENPFFVTLWSLESHHLVAATEEDKAVYPDTEEPQRTYNAAVSRLDELVGDLVATLEEQGRLDDTIIVFSSDNGPENSQPLPGDRLYYSVGSAGDRRGQKRSLYMGGVNVPFLVRWPGVTTPGFVDETTPLSSADMLPTLCAAVGIELPDGYESDGEDVTGALRGETFARSKPLFWEWQGEHYKEADWADLSMRDGDWTFLINTESNRRELYNLATDPGQIDNLVEGEAEKAREMESAVLAWKETLPAEPPVLRMRGDTGQSVKAGRTGIFERWDADGDGSLSLEEYRAKIKTGSDAETRFQRFDKNSDGTLSSEEFVNK